MAISTADYVAASARELAARVRARDVAPVELLHAAFARLDEVNGTLGAVYLIAEDVAQRALERMDAQAPFAGVPFLVKDLGAPLAGTPTIAGCRHLKETAPPSPFDGDIIVRLKAAGLLPFGKTTVPEFGFSLATEPAIGPICRNPWDLSRMAGGSSGGAAAAVAAGIVPMAHATDAGGSIRVPAAACGLVGLKPGRNVIPQGPDFSNVLFGLASELVVSRTVADSAMAFAVATGLDGDDAYWAAFERPSPPLRIALLTAAPQGLPVAQDWASAAHSAAAHLTEAGHHIEPLQPERLATICSRAAEAFAAVICLSLAAAAETLQPAPNGFEPITWAAVERGRRSGPVEVFAAQTAIAGVTHELAVLFEDYDVVLSPGLAHAPPPIGSFPTDSTDLDAHLARFESFAPFAAMANAGGVPAIAVPHGSDAAGLPTGIQLMGPAGSEGLLLRLAHHLEMAAPWPQLATPVKGMVTA